MATCTSYSSATSRHVEMAAGVVPQSSCSFRPMAPARTCSTNASGSEALPFPRKPRLTGNSSALSSMRPMFQEPGVQVVAFVPVAGPVPPPSKVVIPEDKASRISCGQMKCTWLSTPPAVTILPSPAMTSVPGPIVMPGETPDMRSGLPAFPMATMHPSRMPISALTMPQ